MFNFAYRESMENPIIDPNKKSYIDRIVEEAKSAAEGDMEGDEDDHDDKNDKDMSDQNTNEQLKQDEDEDEMEKDYRDYEFGADYYDELKKAPDVKLNGTYS
jgi:hypothetical protein